MQSADEPVVAFDEQAAVRRARVDPAEFGLLYELYFERVFRYVLARSKRRDDAEDITTEVFIAAMRGLRGFRGGSFGAWLFRIAHNQLLNHERAQRHRRHEILRESVGASGDFSESVQNSVAVWDLLQYLTSKQQQAIALKFAAGLSTGEIATVMGSDPSAAKMLVLRALHRLRQLLREGGELE